jgi:hypothetical protein
MKNYLWLVLTIGLFSSVAILLAVPPQLSCGYGKPAVVVTTTPQLITIVEGTNAASATSVSIDNAGASTVFFAVNVTLGVFSNMVVEGTALPVRPNMSYTIEGTEISTVAIQTTNGVSSAFVGAHAVRR